MVTYVRRTCSRCGIQLPKPEMCERRVTPKGVRGNRLPSRLKWFCSRCASPSPWGIHQSRAKAEWAERAKAERAEQEAAAYKDKKRLWREEQERRRLANLARRTMDDAVQNVSEVTATPPDTRAGGNDMRTKPTRIGAVIRSLAYTTALPICFVIVAVIYALITG